MLPLSRAPVMPRAARRIAENGTYHVLTRGNNGQTVFHQSDDYRRYLQLLLGYSRSCPMRVHHFVLMPEHVHLVVSVSSGPAFSKAMLGLNLSYTLFYRKRYQYRGHLWQGRFRSLPLDRPEHLLDCGRYVELNPVRASLVQDPGSYAWSSYRFYAQGADTPAITPNPHYAGLGTTAAERQQRYRQFVADQPAAAQQAVRFERGAGHHPETDPNTTLQSRFGLWHPRGRPGRPRKAEALANERQRRMRPTGISLIHHVK